VVPGAGADAQNFGMQQGGLEHERSVWRRVERVARKDAFRSRN
jgi:hypothetical protein